VKILGSLKLATAPAVEPISLDEAKLHLRVDISDDDTLITSQIQTARRRAEKIAGRAFITQTWDYVLDAFPQGDTLEIPKPPLQSITSIKYYDQDGTEYTLSSDDYYVDTYGEPGRVVLKSSATWPSITLREANGVVVRFMAGYGDADDVPEEFKQAIYLLVGHFYENREAVSDARLVPTPDGVMALLWMDRMKGF
jgi:uncharacterized phiE125 gp8 family phage protein